MANPEIPAYDSACQVQLQDGTWSDFATIKDDEDRNLAIQAVKTGKASGFEPGNYRIRVWQHCQERLITKNDLL